MSALESTYNFLEVLSSGARGCPPDPDAQEGEPAAESDFLYPIDQTPVSVARGENGDFVLWGDVFIPARHPQRLGMVANFPAV